MLATLKKNVRKEKNRKKGRKNFLRGHSDLNQGPIGLQPIALPLSYTPNWQQLLSNKCLWTFFLLKSVGNTCVFRGLSIFVQKVNIGNEVKRLHLIKITSYQNKEISQNHKESDAFSEPVSTSSTRHDDARCRFRTLFFFRRTLTSNFTLEGPAKDWKSTMTIDPSS